MTFWILAGIAVHFAAVFAPALFVLGGLGLRGYLGTRDEEPEPGPHHGRAQRALRNAQESFAAFLALALLAMILPDADLDQARFGAAVVVLARAVYLPLYILGVPYLRSGAWIVGAVGFVAMFAAVI